MNVRRVWKEILLPVLGELPVSRWSLGAVTSYVLQLNLNDEPGEEGPEEV